MRFYPPSVSARHDYGASGIRWRRIASVNGTTEVKSPVSWGLPMASCQTALGGNTSLIATFSSFGSVFQLNQTLLQVGKWPKFATGRPKFESPISAPNWGRKTGYFGQFLQFTDLTVNTFGIKRDLDSRKMASELQRVPYNFAFHENFLNFIYTTKVEAAFMYLHCAFSTAFAHGGHLTWVKQTLSDGRGLFGHTICHLKSCGSSPKTGVILKFLASLAQFGVDRTSGQCCCRCYEAQNILIWLCHCDRRP